MTQAELLLVFIGLALIAIAISFIALFVSLINRKKQRLPQALSNKLGVIAIILEARSNLSDTATLCVRQIQHINSLNSVELDEKEERARRSFEKALENIDRCEHMCTHIRAMNSVEFERYPGFILRAEEMLIDASTERSRENENLLDLKMEHGC